MERPVSYVRDNFIYARDILNDADLEDQLERWLEKTANVRIHGTVKEQPVVRYERDERIVLRPLPPRPYRSLVLDQRRPAAVDHRVRSPKVPVLGVERRPLADYQALVGGPR